MALISNPVEVCNLALLYVKQRTITALDDSFPQSEACAAIYEQCRRALLEEFDWSFARKSSVLNHLHTNRGLRSDDPAYRHDLMGYTELYALPAGLIKARYLLTERDIPIVSPGDIPSPAWRRVSGGIVTSEKPNIKLVYTADTTDAELVNFTPLAIECLAYKIAMKLAPSCTDSHTWFGGLETLYRNTMITAKMSDSDQSDATGYGGYIDDVSLSGYNYF